MAEEKQDTQQNKEEPMDGNEPIFENGPTQSMVENWKQQFQGGVYLTEFEDQTFVWRCLNRTEYKNIVNTEGEQSEWYLEERVTEMCVVWPKDYNHEDIANDMAGTPSTLFEQIMNKSGFMSKGGAQKL